MSQEFEGAKIFKAQGLLNRTGQNTDAYMAIVAMVPALPVGFEANAVVEAIQLADVEAAGVNASFDANNNVMVHYHVDEFFRLAPEGKLVLILTTQTSAEDYLALDIAKTTFKTYSDVKAIGLLQNVVNAELVLADEISAAQAFVNTLALEHVLIDAIYLEGRGIGMGNLADNRDNNAANVCVVIGQDPDIASITAAYNDYAAVGSVMGMRAVRNVSEHLGSTDIITKPDIARGQGTYSLTSDSPKRWQTASLSDGTAFDSLSAVQRDEITDKAHIYAGSYANFDGVYFNGEPTCIDISSDYAQGENNKLWNKAARGIRTALLPKVKSKVKVDPDSGFIRNTSAKYLESVASKPLQKMLADDLISGYTLQIPTDQSPNDQSPLKVNATITKDRIVHVFEVTLGIN